MAANTLRIHAFKLVAIAWASMGVATRLAPGEPPAKLASLQHVVKQFDFEEPDAAPNSLPVPFYRYIAPASGYPPFGTMRLTTTSAFAGNGSLEFELGGGSMSARIPTAVIPILPFTDYTVTTHVRTHGLVHARARIAAWLHDKTGQVIRESRAVSRLANTAGEWETLTVEIRGLEADAADLVLELQVVQPSQVSTTAGDPDQPRLEDIAGRVWFDEVVVTHLPQIHLSLEQPRNIVHWPDVPQARVYVNEATTEPLTARLQVFNVDGELQYDSTFPAPRGPSSGSLRLPIQRCGWYRALLHITSQSGVARQRWLDFTIVPTQVRNAANDRRLGVALPLIPDEQHTAALLRDLNCRAAIAPVWGNVSLNESQQKSLHRVLQELVRDDVEMVFALESLPERLSRNAGVEPSQVLAALAMDQKIWQPFLNELLVNFGLEVSRWQIGSTSSPDAFWHNDSLDLIQAVQSSMAAFVPRATLYTAWSIDQAIEPGGPQRALSIVAPHHVQPQALEEYASVFREAGADFFVHLEPIAIHAGSARQRVTDVTLRALYAWRAGVPQIIINGPWSTVENDRSRRAAYQNTTVIPESDSTTARNRAGIDEPMPEPLFGPWRTLATHLSGRKFIGEVVVGEYIHCWMMRGTSIADSALVMWSDSSIATPVTMQLAGSSVSVHDIYGNQFTATPVDGMHTISISETPIFVERVNVNLVQFRGSVRIEPDFIPAVNKVHEHEIVIRNPWEMPISGTIRLLEGDQWQLLPTVQSFSIQAGGNARLPLTIIPQRNIIAGAKSIACVATLNADQAYAIELNLDLRAGLQNIDLKASWTADRNGQTGELDLLVTQAVTNHGQKPVHLDMYVLGDDIGQLRRTIAGLGPGETAVRTFRVPNGATLLGGKQIRVGVSERDSSVRLNRLLTIGPQPNDSIQARGEEQ